MRWRSAPARRRNEGRSGGRYTRASAAARASAHQPTDFAGAIRAPGVSMRLSTIKISGFKSFVDPTVIQLPTNLTAIVGPNGCGKSNIIDAVRWVMGESAASRLRGDQLADVIFSGSGAQAARRRERRADLRQRRRNAGRRVRALRRGLGQALRQP